MQRITFSKNQTQHISAQTSYTNSKHGGGGVMIWACLVAHTSHLAVTEVMRNSVCQGIIESAMRLYVRQLKLKFGHAAE